MGLFKRNESADQSSDTVKSEPPSGWTDRHESVYQWYTQGEDRPNGREMFKHQMES